MKIRDGHESHFRGGMLQDWCDAIRGHCTGASDPMPGQLAEEAVGYLDARLEDWQEPSDEYDKAVRALVETTLRVYRGQI